MKRTSLHRLLLAIVLMGAGMGVGSVLSTSNEAHGQARGSLPPNTLQSGGQLSLPVLQEIAATLKQIDSRLARLEAAAQKLHPPRPGVARGTE